MMNFDITALARARAELHRVNTALSARADKLAAMQAQLAERTERAEAATRAKSAFLANMSHEIRTPMNAILDLTHLMTRETGDATQHDRLGKVNAAAKHLLQIVNDILDLSKVEAGKMVLDEADFALDGLLDMVSGTAREKQLALVQDTASLPRHLRGDATRLAQMLINLLSNAVKFTQAGQVLLRDEVLVDDGRRLQLRFEVEDTGPGLEADRLARLFLPFEQADASITRSHGGAGGTGARRLCRDLPPR